MALIYLITNIKNGNRYVGKTTKTCKSRMSRHITTARLGYTTRLAKTIRKYGSESFTIEMLEQVLDESMLNEREVFYIAKLKPEYNMTEGGDGGAQVTPEARAKISKAAKKRVGNKNPFFGKSHNKEAKEKMRNFRLGKSLDAETKKKLSEASTKALSKKYLVTRPDGTSITVTGLKTFCKENSLVYTTMFATIKNGPSGGWCVKRL